MYKVELSPIINRKFDKTAIRYCSQHNFQKLPRHLFPGINNTILVQIALLDTTRCFAAMRGRGPYIGLADARLAYVAGPSGGKVIRSDFFPAQSGSYRGAPESGLYRVTACSLNQILLDAIMRSRIDKASRNLSTSGNANT